MNAKPRGSQQVKVALVAAAVRLLGQRPPHQISGRELAEEAGVNYGLVHHYFGSKEVLLQAGLADLASSFAEGPIDESWSSDEPFSIRHRMDYLRALTFSSISGELEGLSTVHPVIEDSLKKVSVLRGKGQDSNEQTLIDVAVGTLFQLGWSLFEQRVLPGFAFDKEEEAEFEKRLRATLRAIMLDGDVAKATQATLHGKS